MGDWPMEDAAVPLLRKNCKLHAQEVKFDAYFQTYEVAYKAKAKRNTCSGNRPVAHTSWIRH